jgi:hypothetical protein
MKKSRTVKQKVIGRPRTGITPLMGFRADPATRAEIVRWAEKQPDMPSLSEAIRRLVELGLTVKPALRPSAKAAARAAELAAKVIDRHIDPKAPIEEREVRKQRLLKGPPVFRDLRKDLAK